MLIVSITVPCELRCLPLFMFCYRRSKLHIWPHSEGSLCTCYTRKAFVFFHYIKCHFRSCKLCTLKLTDGYRSLFSPNTALTTQQQKTFWGQPFLEWKMLTNPIILCFVDALDCAKGKEVVQYCWTGKKHTFSPSFFHCHFRPCKSCTYIDYLKMTHGKSF